MTTRAKFRFVPKQNTDGSPWLTFEPRDGQLGEGLPSGLFGFDLLPGTTYEQAEEIGHYLGRHIASLNFTAMDLR